MSASKIIDVTSRECINNTFKILVVQPNKRYNNKHINSSTQHIVITNTCIDIKYLS